MNLEEIRSLINKGDIEFIRFEQSDTHGISRSKTVFVKHLEGLIAKGLNFPLPPLAQDVQGFVAAGTGYGAELGFTDILLLPDTDTFQVLPWLDKTARVLCNPFFINGRPVAGAPRNLLQKLIAELESMGYQVLSGFEYECCLVNPQTLQPWVPGIQNFAALNLKFDANLIYKLLRDLSATGLDITAVNSEHGPGQLEINTAPAWGIEAADQAFTFKNSTKEIVYQAGTLASFMTQPPITHLTNGCHYNHSLWQGDQNAFFDPEQPDGISNVCRHFLAGQLAHAEALCALASPTINCFKRYQARSATPSNATWGINNRTVALRVKAFSDPRTHLENRLGGGAANPYLLMAGCLAAGLDGLKRTLEPPQPSAALAYETSARPLPTRLEQALAALEQNEVMQAALGEEFIQLFVALKRHEIKKAQAAIADYDSPEFLTQVDPWEPQEYFELL